MHEHHGFASVQLFENWLVIRMTQPFIVVAGEESNAIRLEHTIGVLDLTEAGIGIRKGNYGEVTKAARVISHEISSVFIYSARHSSRCLAVSVPECDRGKGENSRRDAALFIAAIISSGVQLKKAGFIRPPPAATIRSRFSAR